MNKVHKIEDLMSLFNQCFQQSFNTVLTKGFDEPIYLPPNTGYDSETYTIKALPEAQIVFAHGYYASALHEIAHWCLAGEQRRQQIDYGYWYSPDGRTAEQQAKFQLAEIKPQAIEWALSMSAGFKFQVSCDNLSGDEFGNQPDVYAFEQEIRTQLNNYLNQSKEPNIPQRAQQFMECLKSFYKTEQIHKTESTLKLEKCHDQSAA